MMKYLVPAIAVVLFLVEPEFAMLSPLKLGDASYYFVPRFLLLFLMFVAIYYNRKNAMLYAFIFGCIYDIFYIDIIGVYTVLYVSACFVASWCVKFIHQHLVNTTILSVVLLALTETILYGFYSLIGFTEMAFSNFLIQRLVPTVVANILYLVLLGWFFKYIILQLLKKERSLTL